MHENAPTIKATKRERTGSRYTKRVREAGDLPAIVYGHGQDPMAVALDGREAVRHINLGEKVFKFEIEGAGEELVLLRDLQYDYLGTNLVHADFSRVDLAEKVTAHVHINLKGDAPGLKAVGSVMTHPVSELTIECSIKDLPELIDVSIENLESGGTIFAKDVVLPEGVELKSPGDDVIAHIVGASHQQGEDVEGEGEASGPEITKQKTEE